MTSITLAKIPRVAAMPATLTLPTVQPPGQVNISSIVTTAIHDRSPLLYPCHFRFEDGLSRKTHPGRPQRKNVQLLKPPAQYMSPCRSAANCDTHGLMSKYGRLAQQLGRRDLLHPASVALFKYTGDKGDHSRGIASEFGFCKWGSPCSLKANHTSRAYAL